MLTRYYHDPNQVNEILHQEDGYTCDAIACSRKRSQWMNTSTLKADDITYKTTNVHYGIVRDMVHVLKNDILKDARD